MENNYCASLILDNKKNVIYFYGSKYECEEFLISHGYNIKGKTEAKKIIQTKVNVATILSAKITQIDFVDEPFAYIEADNGN